MSSLTQPSRQPFRRVLVANRGEIAVRIIRSLRELGLESVAVYSDADSSSMHRLLADFAVRLPGQASSETYLNIPALMQAIKSSGADAVHPGYGFLSENEAFASTVLKAGVTFIGPTPEAMQLMGDKIAARNLMKAHGVPVVPGSSKPISSLAELKDLAQTIGFPIILKAAAGGGGRGMRVVRAAAELEDALAACQREAQAYFGNPAVFCERYIEFPRHIEFQVLFDMHGEGVHLFERDCSLQRRHQKLLEEAPSAYLSETTRQKMGEIALAAGKACGYVGAGTVEFICESPEKAYFMEMNTRIQVEHPVTEMITGIDLIAWQIRVAQGERLSFRQEDIRLSGWAIETRINAEDPLRDFTPAPGVVSQLKLPEGPFLRVDTHLYQGYEIPSHYDSMVAKVISWGENRDEAIRRMLRALAELKIEGVPTTARFHEAVLNHKDFIDSNLTTRFIEQRGPELFAAMQGRTEPHDDDHLDALLAAVLAVRTQAKAAPVNHDSQKRWQERARCESLE